MPPAVVIAMPRSGSTWLANWLDWAPRRCLHDALAGVRAGRDLAEIASRYNLVETAGSLFYRTLVKWAPAGTRFALLTRDPAAVAASLDRGGYPGTMLAQEAHRRTQEAAEFLERRGPLVRIEHALLGDVRYLRGVWAQLRGDAFDAERTRHLIGCRIDQFRPFVGKGAPTLAAEEASLRSTT